MKVAISCDALVSRTHVTSIVEAVLGVYEDAELYTLVHHAGKILGPVEQRKIHSTYLTNVITEETPFGDEWWKKGLLIPGACKNLTVPCNVDLLINISSGFSQGISKCDGVYQITYLVENQFMQRRPKFLREKVFRAYLENWAEKTIRKSNELWVPTQKSCDYWSKLHSKVSILSPFIKSSDFPLLPEGMRKTFPKDFLCLDAESINTEQAKGIIQKCLDANIKYRFVGSDDHLEGVKKETDDSLFFGSRCSGELAPLLSASRGFICFQKVGFPAHVIESLSCGTPVWLPSDSDCHQYINGPGVFGKTESLENLSAIFEKMGKVDPQKVHGQTNEFNEIKFKASVKRKIDKLGENVLNHCHG